MATRTKLKWKVLDPLLLVLEKEGWSHAMIAEDWGVSPATLEGHLTQEPGMSAISKHDYSKLFEEYDQRLAGGESPKEIRATFESRGVNWGTYQNRRTQWNKAHRSTPAQIPVQTMSTGAEQSADTGAEQLFDEPETQEHIPVQRPVHDSTPSLDSSAENGADDSADESQVLFIPPTPVQTAVQRFDTGPVQILDTGAVQRIDQLEDDVRQLTHMMRSVMDRMNDLPVQTPVQITTTPPYPRGRSVRWNLWILEPIRDEIATLAAERDVSPSQLVQELLWKTLRQE
jgi:hypothetical protein